MLASPVVIQSFRLPFQPERQVRDTRFGNAGASQGLPDLDWEETRPCVMHDADLSKGTRKASIGMFL